MTSVSEMSISDEPGTRGFAPARLIIAPKNVGSTEIVGSPSAVLFPKRELWKREQGKPAQLEGLDLTVGVPTTERVARLMVTLPESFDVTSRLVLNPRSF